MTNPLTTFTDADRNEILQIFIGDKITIADMITEISDDQLPARVTIPASICVDIRTRDDLIEWLDDIFDGVSFRTVEDPYAAGVYDARIYINVGGATQAAVEDPTDYWDKETPDEPTPRQDPRLPG